jgi:hypothetical protein
MLPFFAVFALCRLPSYAARLMLRRMVGLVGGSKIFLVRQTGTLSGGVVVFEKHGALFFS